MENYPGSILKACLTAAADGVKATHIGGQAVLEGVMLRGKEHWSVSVRRPDGKITSQTKPIPDWSKKWKLSRRPFFRGVVALVEAVALGVMALNFSAQESTDEDIEIGAKEMAFTVVIGFGFALALFFALPVWLAGTAKSWVGTMVPASSWSGSIILNLIEGVIRLVIFFGYLWLVSNIKDIKRVFEYHGAEHKTIHALEHGVPLTPGEVDVFGTEHMRCGTSFLLVVMVVSILIFAVLGRPESIPVRIALRFLVLPLVAGLSYEIIKYAGRHEDSNFVRAVMSPGLLLQRLTTRQPSVDQIEVALASLNCLLETEGES